MPHCPTPYPVCASALSPWRCPRPGVCIVHYVKVVLFPPPALCSPRGECAMVLAASLQLALAPARCMGCLLGTVCTCCSTPAPLLPWWRTRLCSLGWRVWLCTLSKHCSQSAVGMTNLCHQPIPPQLPLILSRCCCIWREPCLMGPVHDPSVAVLSWTVLDRCLFPLQRDSSRHIVLHHPVDSINV